MKCPNCGTNFTRSLRVLNSKGKEIIITFCDYDCYLRFWKGMPGFIPLPEFIPEPNPILYVPEPVKKKRIQLNRHISYKKDTYCF